MSQLPTGSAAIHTRKLLQIVLGLLMATYYYSTPPKKEAGNVRSYYLGHYQCGINVQAVCDHQSCFPFFLLLQKVP
jgi:hypothetical protein